MMDVIKEVIVEMATMKALNPSGPTDMIIAEHLFQELMKQCKGSDIDFNGPVIFLGMRVHRVPMDYLESMEPYMKERLENGVVLSFHMAQNNQMGNLIMEHFSKHLRIEPVQSVLRKKPAWAVRSAHDNLSIGFIEWFNPWKIYAFHPGHNTVYDADCLREISNFLRRINSPDPKEQLKSFKEGPQ